MSAAECVLPRTAIPRHTTLLTTARRTFRTATASPAGGCRCELSRRCHAVRSLDRLSQVAWHRALARRLTHGPKCRHDEGNRARDRRTRCLCAGSRHPISGLGLSGAMDPNGRIGRSRESPQCSEPARGLPVGGPARLLALEIGPDLREGGFQLGGTNVTAGDWRVGGMR